MDAGPSKDKYSTWQPRLRGLQFSRLELSSRSRPSGVADCGNVCHTLKVLLVSVPGLAHLSTF